METNTNHAIVGAFVIALLATIVLTITWLTSGLSTGSYSIYKIYMKESVSGLSLESPVEFNGVDVGSVSSIDIDPRNPMHVVLLIKIKQSTPITTATQATLKVKGLTGNAYIALDNQNADMTPLKTTAGEAYPVIMTGPSFFLQVDTALSTLSEHLSQVSKSFQSLLDEENLHSIKEILANLSQTTKTLTENNQQLITILQNAAHVSEQLTAQTIPTANQALSNLSEATHNLSTITTEIKQNPALLIRGREQQPYGPGEK